MKNQAKKNISNLNVTAKRDSGFSCLGHIVDVSEEGKILVDFKENNLGRPQIAHIVSPSQIMAEKGGNSLVGCSVLLLFEENDLLSPVIVGVVHDHIPYQYEKKDEAVTMDMPLQASIDGMTVLLEAKKEIVLSCGKSSITLTKDGKIIVKGTQLVSRSSGTNKIKGAAVSIN